MLAVVVLGTALLLALGLAAAIGARLLRPSRLKALIAGDLPALRGIKGRFSFFGQEFETDATFDDRADQMLRDLSRRVDTTEVAIRELTRDRKTSTAAAGRSHEDH